MDLGIAGKTALVCAASKGLGRGCALALARETPERVRTCAAPDCEALYLDTSRNRSRRWCSMEKGGARAKASAYYRRHRSEA